MFNNFLLYIYCTDGALKRLWILLSSSEECCVLLEQKFRLLVLSGAGFKFFSNNGHFYYMLSPGIWS